MRLPFALLLGLVPLLTASAAASEPLPEPARSTPWTEIVLPRVEIPADTNALLRWRPLFSRLIPADVAVHEQLQTLASPLRDFSGGDHRAVRDWLGSLAPVLSEFALRENESLQLPPLIGPETPFPDHQPLWQLALVRTAALKKAWLNQRRDEALALALENLALSRALLCAQEGLVPLINACSVWQLSLDGVYWLARQPDLTPAQAARLQLALLRDDRLATESLARAFRGEFTFFTRVIVERLPRTHDVELLLSSIGSLGLAPAEAPAEGEPRLAIAARDPLDRDATLQAAADDVRGWLDAFTAARHPRGLSATHTGMLLKNHAREIPALLRYAVQDEPATAEQIAVVDAEIAAVKNPVGKVFLIITTSQWEPISGTVFRREAQRRALTALLAWRRLGRAASWKELITAGLLPAPPADPFSTAALCVDLRSPRLWSVAENGVDEGGAGDGENLGRPLDLTWPGGPVLESR